VHRRGRSESRRIHCARARRCHPGSIACPGSQRLKLISFLWAVVSRVCVCTCGPRDLHDYWRWSDNINRLAMTTIEQHERKRRRRRGYGMTCVGVAHVCLLLASVLLATASTTEVNIGVQAVQHMQPRSTTRQQSPLRFGVNGHHPFQTPYRNGIGEIPLAAQLTELTALSE
jgi:hypothetical protein